MSNSKLRQEIADLRRQLAGRTEHRETRCGEKCDWEVWAEEVCSALEIAKDREFLSNLIFKYIPKHSTTRENPENYRVYNAEPVARNPNQPYMFVPAREANVNNNYANTLRATNPTLDGGGIGYWERVAELDRQAIEDARLNIGVTAADGIYRTYTVTNGIFGGNN